MRGDRPIRIVADQAIRNVNLPRNAVKPHWCEYSTRRLFWLLLVEVWEFAHAVRAYQRAAKEYRVLRRCYTPLEAADVVERLRCSRADVIHEAGDCVAFVGFIVDNVVEG